MTQEDQETVLDAIFDKLDRGVLDEAASKTALEDVILRPAFNSRDVAFASMRSIIKG